MKKTDDEINKAAYDAALSQYGSDHHEEFISTVNGFIMGYNEAIKDVDYFETDGECTKPNCHCAQECERLGTSHIKSYPCLCTDIRNENKFFDSKCCIICEGNFDNPMQKQLGICGDCLKIKS